MAIPRSRPIPEKDLLSVKGLTISQLIAATNKYWTGKTSRFDSAYDCTIKKLTRPSNAQGHLIVFSLIESATEVGKVYKTWFNFLKAKSPSERVHVMAQCECYDYLFRMEYANAAHSAARLFYSNGEPPDSSNPSLHPGLCKHLICLKRELFDR